MSVWLKYNDDELKEINSFCDGYREFLDKGKTERECIESIISEARKNGFKDISEYKELKKGDKVYATGMNKTAVLFKIGNDISEGMNIVTSHIDSPRLDIKQKPLYEKDGFAYLDTHYYGGIKKYQWVTIPLAIHGVVVKKDLSTIKLSIGENSDEPVFCISDLLVHLSGKQLEKKASVVIEGEKLDILFGNIPNNDEEKDSVKENVLKILKQYGIEEDDFISAELEVVPSGKARELGIDKSMILAYGQDDRVCAYAELSAFMEAEAEKTMCALFVDKEEIGSVGATGLKSKFFENSVCEVMELCGKYSELNFRRCMKRTNMFSADVNAGYDPMFSEAFDKENSALFGDGAVFSKFTGSRGKSGSNDANAEYIAKIRKILDEDEVAYQTAELGKVDYGGGGTIAYIASLYEMNVIDCGVAVLNMHAPYEITSKADVYETKKAFVSFYNKM